MDKIVYFIHHADQAINKSIECLNDPSMFNNEIQDEGSDFEKVQVFELSNKDGNERSDEIYYNRSDWVLDYIPHFLIYFILI